jgi:hypothetical protein
MKFASGKAFGEFYGDEGVGGTPAQPSTPAPGGAAVAVGTQRTINGTPAVWDGHGWVAR